MQDNWRKTVKSLHYSMTTYEYGLWDADELEIRGFLISSNRGMNEWFNVQWQAAKEEADRIFDPDFDDVSLPVDLFTDSVGVYPDNYFWQLSSAVIKDACGLYEVYLERTANSIAQHHGARLKTLSTEDSWRWVECRAFYRAYLDFDVTPTPIENIIWMRNKMAHLRDELRTGQGLADFERRLQELAISNPATTEEATLGLSDDNPSYIRRGVAISLLQTYRMLDIIRSQVNSLTLHLLPFVHGEASNAYLDALRAGSPIPVKNFSHDKLLAPWPAQ